jgi:L-ascorbate metabolism protein UlaG (beta-lactamase superfamily)
MLYFCYTLGVLLFLMHITWHGKTCLKISADESTVLVDPYGGKDGLRAGQQADLVLVGDGDLELAGSLTIGAPLVIGSPGEYETKGIFVYGLAEVDADQHPLGRTFFVLKAEGMSIGMLGAFRQEALVGIQEEIVEGVDVLFVPVGGGSSLGAREAAALVTQIEPRVVVPYDYASADPSTVDAFFKAVGAKHIETVEKIKLSAKQLPQEDMQYYRFV